MGLAQDEASQERPLTTRNPHEGLFGTVYLDCGVGHREARDRAWWSAAGLCSIVGRAWPRAGVPTAAAATRDCNKRRAGAIPPARWVRRGAGRRGGGLGNGGEGGLRGGGGYAIRLYEMLIRSRRRQDLERARRWLPRGISTNTKNDKK